MLPEELGTARLIGTFLDTNGDPDPGVVTLAPDVPWLRRAGSPGTALDRRAVNYWVNQTIDGVLSPDAVPLEVLLLATDNASVSPSGWGWRADIRLRNRRDTVYFYAPTDSVIDLATIASTVPATPREYQVRSVGGVFPDPAGNVDVASLPGTAGDDGPAGRGITDARLVGGHLLLDFTDATTDDVGQVVGANGTNGPPGADGDDGLDGIDGDDGVLEAFTDTGPFFGTFGALAGVSGSWTVCPAAWRSVPAAADSGNVLDWQPEVVLGVGTATADAEFDVAAIDNSVPGAPVILRCLSSNTNTPLANGHGGFYCWQNNARRLPGTKWRVQAGDVVGGTVTLAILYRSAGSGLAIGHASAYPSRVTVANLGTPRV